MTLIRDNRLDGPEPIPRRILMTADPIGGVFNYALTLCRELCGKGIEVALATMGRFADREQRAATRRISGLQLFESDYALEWMDSPWAGVDRAGEWLLEVSRKVQPDVVHLNGYSHAALHWEVPVIVVAHSCVASWWRAIFGEPAPARFDEYRRRVAVGLSSADLVISPSLAMSKMLDEEHGITRCRVIPNGALPSEIVPAFKEELFLSCSRLWDPAKNVQALVQIAARLPWKVRVAGDRAGPNGVQEDLGPAVEYLGTLPQKALFREMERALVFVHPAKYEPFGLAPLEAALRGCALVLGDIESLRETWADAALYVPPEDSDAMLETLSRLATDTAARNRMAAKALARATEFSAERMADEYLDAYSGLLPASRRMRHGGTREGSAAVCLDDTDARGAGT